MQHPIRDPKAILHDQLLKLSESEEWQVYKGILLRQYEEIRSSLTTVLSTQEQIANHNAAVGLLTGILKAVSYLESKITELERDMKARKDT